MTNRMSLNRHAAYSGFGNYQMIDEMSEGRGQGGVASSDLQLYNVRREIDPTR